MPRPRISVLKRQREQAKRERQQRKAERREDRKRQDAEKPHSPVDDDNRKT
jgi:hypothetical protein